LIYYDLGVEYDRDTIRIPSSGGGISGSGTTNYVSKWTGTTSQGNSQIFDNGTNVGIGTTTPEATFEAKGPGTTSSTLSFLVRNGLSQYMFFIRDDNMLGTTSTRFDFNNPTRSVNIGRSAGLNENQSAFRENVLIGYEAGKNISTGGLNLFLGTESGLSITTGQGNTALGRRSLFNASNSIINAIAIGDEAGYNLSGLENITIGLQAGYQMSGNYSVAIGSYTSYNGGSNSTKVGIISSPDNASSNVSAFGYHSGRYQSGTTTPLTSAANSVYIGASTKGTQSSTNENVLGYGAEGKGSNTATIGNSSVTVLYLAGAVGWFQGTGSPEGVVTAPVGSFYSNKSGGAGTTFYVKESGTGNVGWIGK
jgi:hypothetical protein